MACGGSQSGRVSSKFSRKGTSRTDQSRTIPSFLTSLITSNLSTGDIGSSLSALQNSFLGNVMSQDYANPTGKSELNDIMVQDPRGFTGSGAVSSIANVNPFSQDYLAALESFYDDVFSQAAAAGRTGQDAVHGGAAHGAMVESNLLERAALDKFRELNKIQQAQSGITLEGARTAGALEAQRQGEIMQAQNQTVQQFLAGLGIGTQGASSIDQRRQLLSTGQGIAGELTGTKQGLTTDDLSGTGLQNSSHSGWQAGVSCCFIFLEALNGQLPWYVRRARDEMGSEKTRRGYRRMSAWLVPAMRRSRIVRALVNHLMVRPLIKWGAYHYVAAEHKRWWRLLKPVKSFWFHVWDRLGV